jgi:hypothetical protein
LNGTDVSGETASTYTNSALSNNSVVKVVMTSNSTAACLTQSPATSNSITTVVNQPTASSASITACDSYSWNGSNYNATGIYCLQHHKLEWL